MVMDGSFFMLAAGVLVFFGILILLRWQSRRRRAASRQMSIISTANDPWRQRALIAEQRMEKMQAAARAGLISQIAAKLSTPLMQRLTGQQAGLLKIQQKMAAEMTELDLRLEKIHAPLQERLSAYEFRIAELEKKLARKDEENQELLKAKIILLKKHLETERASNRLIVNPEGSDSWEIQLKPGLNTLGRGLDNDFKMEDPSVSVHHCHILVSETGVIVKDLNSTNGTQVNRTRVEAVVIQPGQRLRLGNVEMLFVTATPLPVTSELANSSC
jgi:hypothetical protein